MNKSPENKQVADQLRGFVKKGMDTVCINMAVPFLESVKLGAIQEGLSRLLVADKESHIEVTQPNSGFIDNYIYGQVRHVTSIKKSLFLEIEHPSSCIRFERFETIYNGSDTCSVLPIMKKVQNSCPRDPQTFEYELKIPPECLQRDKVLFHVRSLEGKSVNYLFENRS